MTITNNLGPLDTIETLLVEALRLSEVAKYSLTSAKIAESLDAVAQTKGDHTHH
jgi:hypothetical protein